MPGAVAFFETDLTDSTQVEAMFAQANPDVVLHGAAMTHVDDCELNQEACWSNNVTATQHVINGCKAVGAHLVYVSTDFIFDGTKGPLTEEERPNPVNFYGKSKLAAEELVMGQLSSWAIARTVLVYGVAQGIVRSNIVLWVKQSLEAGKPIKVVNDQWRTPTLTEDLAMGCWLIAKGKKHGIFNISGRDFLTPYDIAIQTARFFKLDESLITATDSNQFKQPAARPLRTGFSIAKAQRELGYKPHTFLEGLELMKEQLASN